MINLNICIYIYNFLLFIGKI